MMLPSMHVVFGLRLSSTLAHQICFWLRRQAVRRSFKVHFKLGRFDPPNASAWVRHPASGSGRVRSGIVGADLALCALGQLI